MENLNNLLDQGYFNIQAQERQLFGENVTLIVADYKSPVDGEVSTNWAMALYRTYGRLQTEHFEEEYTFDKDGLDKMAHDLVSRWEGASEAQQEREASGEISYALGDGLTDFGDGVRRKR